MILDDAIIENFDGFIVATEPATHFELAKKVF